MHMGGRAGWSWLEEEERSNMAKGRLQVPFARELEKNHDMVLRSTDSKRIWGVVKRGFPHTTRYERGVTTRSFRNKKFLVILASIDGRIVIQHLWRRICKFRVRRLHV